MKAKHETHDDDDDDDDEEEQHIDIEEEDIDEPVEEKVELKKNEEEEEQEEKGRFILPTPPPAKVAKTRTKKIPTHNVVSSTTADEQLPDMNMFFPPTLLPPLPPPAFAHYFPFPPPLPSSNSTDWLQFFRSPLFVPSSFRFPSSTIPRRFPFEFNTPHASMIGSGAHSAFKPPIQKHE